MKWNHTAGKSEIDVKKHEEKWKLKETVIKPRIHTNSVEINNTKPTVTESDNPKLPLNEIDLKITTERADGISETENSIPISNQKDKSFPEIGYILFGVVVALILIILIIKCKRRCSTGSYRCGEHTNVPVKPNNSIATSGV